MKWRETRGVDLSVNFTLKSTQLTQSHAKIREGFPPALTILVGVGSVVVVVGSAVLVVSVVVMVFPKEQVVGSVVVVVAHLWCLLTSEGGGEELNARVYEWYVRAKASSCRSSIVYTPSI